MPVMARTHLGSNDRNIRRPAKVGPRTGRSLSRSGSKLLADLLARDPSESQALDHRRRAIDLHPLDGRDRRQLFLIGRDSTLPLEIWGRLRRGITPEINAVSTIIFVFSLLTIIIWYRLRVRAEGSVEAGAELLATTDAVRT